LDNEVIFTSPILNREIPAFLSAAKIRGVLCLPSLHEGIPRCLLEAMSMGVPVIATKVGGVPELIHHEKTGILVPPRDPKKLAEAIIRLLTDYELSRKIGRQGKLVVRSRYSWEATLAQLMNLFNSFF